MSLSVAVVTSTRGRPLLKKAIESVQAQTRKARHYVFAHGEDCWADVALVPNIRNTTLTLLTVNNGAGGYAMAPVFAAAPYLVSEDVILFLDDDNWYEPTHIEEVVGMIEAHSLGWAYSLRKIVDADGNFICDDNCESLGMHPNSHGHYLVDNSCYAVKAEFARQYGHAWYVPVVSDRAFMRALCQAKIACGATGKHSVNYRLSHDGSGGMTKDMFLGNNKFMHDTQPGFPWLQKSIFKY